MRRPIVTEEDGEWWDLFAGGGGASVGIEDAIGRPVDGAINHDEIAMMVHEANHPRTRHYPNDIWRVSPRRVTGGRKIYGLWCSPDCTDFSVAKGGRPRRKHIRMLANVIIRWARELMPTTIWMENVREFVGWGPLDSEGRRIEHRKGEHFRRWKRKLEALGYIVEWRVLDCSQHESIRTKRKRFFLMARRDGRPIVWPEPAYGPGLKQQGTAAECIDWSIPCQDIFDRPEPLAEKTLWRVVQGMYRFVLTNPRPFIVKFRGDAHSSDSLDPMPTITAGHGIRPAGAGHGLGLAGPYIVKANHGKLDPRGESIEEPLTTVTATSRGHALVTPIMATIDQQGSKQGATAIDAPLPTTVAKNRHAIIAPVIAGVGGPEYSGKPSAADQPLGTIMKESHKVVIVPVIAGVGGRAGQSAPTGMDQPVGTITAKNDRAIIAPVIATYHKNSVGQVVDEPIPTVLSHHKHALVAPVIAPMNANNPPMSVEKPLGTVTSQHNRFDLVAPSLVQTGYGERKEHHGMGPDQGPRVLDIEEPLGTIVASNKFGLVAAYMHKGYGEEPGKWVGASSASVESPVPAITARDHNNVAAAALVNFRGTDPRQPTAQSPHDPLPTISSGGIHTAECRAFLTAYYGSDGNPGKGQSVGEPLRAVTGTDRFGVVMVEIQAELTDEERYSAWWVARLLEKHGVLPIPQTGPRASAVLIDAGLIVRIGLRMLWPHELLRAQFGRFADTYDLSAAIGKRTLAKLRKLARRSDESFYKLLLTLPEKDQQPVDYKQVELIGNSVPPEMVSLLVRLNTSYAERRRKAA